VGGSVNLSVCLSVCLSLSVSVCLSVSLSVCLSVCLSYLSVCLSLCLSMCLSCPSPDRLTLFSPGTTRAHRRLWSLCAFTQGQDFTWGLLSNASTLLQVRSEKRLDIHATLIYTLACLCTYPLGLWGRLLPDSRVLRRRPGRTLALTYPSTHLPTHSHMSIRNTTTTTNQRAGHQAQATKDFVFYGPEPEDALTRECTHACMHGWLLVGRCDRLVLFCFVLSCHVMKSAPARLADSTPHRRTD
jgi:hypothetical protein